MSSKLPSKSEVDELYEINDDPKRKEFLDDLFSFMQKRGTPINRLPIMAKSVLDLYELYNLVIARGGLVDVINKKLWQEIIKGLHLPSSITSAAFTLRTQYMKYLYPYECDKRHLSTPSELQAAIDGNRREGRRSSYGQYDSMSRYGYESAAATHPMNPLSLVTAAQQQQLAARMNSVMAGGMNLHNGAHHPAHPQPMNPPTNGVPLPNVPNMASDFETRMIEYMKMINKEMRATNTTSPRQIDLSPPNATSAMTPFEVQTRMNIFGLYNNQNALEPQREPINLSEPAQAIKREPDCRESSPPSKRVTRAEEERHRRPRTPDSPVHTSNTHIKINSRGESGSGDNSLVVSMELNGVTYQGVLFAQTAPNNSLTA